MKKNHSVRNSFSRAKEIRRNVTWSTIDFAVFPAAMLIATPIFIHHLGIEQFGVLILFNALVGISLVFNFGFGDAVLKYVSHYIHLDQKERAASIIRTIGAITLAIGIALGFLFASLIPLTSKLFNVETLSYATPTLFLVSIIIPLRMLESVYVASLRGQSRYDLSGKVTLVSKLLTVGMQIVLVNLGYELPALYFVTVVVVAASTITLFFVCWKKLGNVMPFFTHRDFKEVRRFSSWSWIQGIASLMIMNADRLMIAALMGPSVLGVYGVCLQVAQNMHNGIAALSHPVFPRISALSSKKLDETERKNELRSLYIDASMRVTVLAVLAGSTVAVFSYEILYFWVGVDIAEKAHVLLSLVAISSCWFTSNQVITTYTLNGLGFAKLQAAVAVIGAVLLTLGSYTFITIIGAVGAAVSRYLEIPVRLAARIYLGKKIIGGVRARFAFDFLWLTLAAVLICFLFKQAILYINNDRFLLHRVDVIILFPMFLWLLYSALTRINAKLDIVSRS